MSKIKLIFFVILFCFIPLYYSQIFNNIGEFTHFEVKGNFEFTKSTLFIFLISIFYSFFIFFKKKSLQINKYLIYILIFLVLSSILSISPFYSFYGNFENGHGFFFFSALLLLFAIFQSVSEVERKIIEKIIILSNIIFSIIFLYLFIKNNINYGTLGHHNYVALFELLTIPLYFHYIKSKKWYYYIGLIISIFCLLLSQSFIGITVFFLYLFYIITNKNSKKTLLFSLFPLFIGVIVCFFYFPEKLHSLVSRYYIWETSLRIIFSQIKIFFIGAGPETLPYYFGNYKSSYLYIFENFGYTANDPHNIFLYIFFHFGIFLCIGLIYLFYKIIREKEKNYIYEGSILFFLFSFFNPINTTAYILITFYFAIIFKKYTTLVPIKASYIIKFVLFLYSIITLVILGGYYLAETYAFENRYSKAQSIFKTPHYYYAIGKYEEGYKKEAVKSQNYFISKLNDTKDIKNDCRQYVSLYYSAEDYFFCGEKLKKAGNKEEYKVYYKKGLSKIPDLWNTNSVYYNNFLIKKTITGNRFYSEKYSEIQQILKELNPDSF